MNVNLKAACLIAVGLLAGGTASATVMNTVQLSAASGGGQITITAEGIKFTPGGFGVCPQNNAAPYSDGTTFCDASVSGGTMTYGVGNTLVNTTYNAVIGDATLSPISVQQPWIIIDTSLGTDVIELTLQGVNAPATNNGTNCSIAVTIAGRTCTNFNGSPFTLEAAPGGSGLGSLGTIVSLSVFGTAKDVTTGQVSNFNGKITQSINDLSPQEVQSLIPSAASNGAITTGFTGSITAAAVPEPTSMFLMSGGLLLLVGSYKRRQAKRQQ